MRPLAIVAVMASALFAAACGTYRSSEVAATAATAEPGVARAADAPDGDRQDPEEQKKKSQQLESKRRELARGELEDRIAELERRSKTMAAAHDLRDAEHKLETAQRELDTFVKMQKPREIEERRINLDRAIHRAEHSKEELAELEAMYDEDEFARNTKELVLKRGRREAEMAERQLQIERKELEEFETHTLPAREDKLRVAVRDAEAAVEKAHMNIQKTEIEIELDSQKAADKRLELEREIDELAKAVGESIR